MKAEYIEYLEVLGIKTIIRERIEEIYKFFSEISSEEIEDLFVSEYLQEDGNRIYEHVRFFSKNFGMVAADFLNTDRFNIFRLNPKNTFALSVRKKDYDFKKANVKSRMTVVLYWLNVNKTSTLKASKENCDYLKNIIIKKYLPII